MREVWSELVAESWRRRKITRSILAMSKRLQRGIRATRCHIVATIRSTDERVESRSGSARSKFHPGTLIGDLMPRHDRDQRGGGGGRVSCSNREHEIGRGPKFPGWNFDFSRSPPVILKKPLRARRRARAHRQLVVKLGSFGGGARCSARSLTCRAARRADVTLPVTLKPLQWPFKLV
jgi:hypothetical protein